MTTKLAISTPGIVAAPATILSELAPRGMVQLTVNDAATLAGANDSNVIYSGTLDEPKSFNSWPITNGIVISAIRGTVSVSYT